MSQTVGTLTPDQSQEPVSYEKQTKITLQDECSRQNNFNPKMIFEAHKEKQVPTIPIITRNEVET